MIEEIQPTSIDAIYDPVESDKPKKPSKKASKKK